MNESHRKPIKLTSKHLDKENTLTNSNVKKLFSSKKKDPGITQKCPLTKECTDDNKLIKGDVKHIFSSFLPIDMPFYIVPETKHTTEKAIKHFNKEKDIQYIEKLKQSLTELQVKINSQLNTIKECDNKRNKILLEKADINIEIEKKTKLQNYISTYGDKIIEEQNEIKKHFISQSQEARNLIDQLIEKQKKLKIKLTELTNKNTEESEKIKNLNVKESALLLNREGLVDDIVSLEAKKEQCIKNVDESSFKLNEIKSKISELDKRRIDTLSHIIALKPFYKVFLVLYKYNNDLNYFDSKDFIIGKTRKDLSISKTSNYKFHYIISGFDNYLISKEDIVSKETEFIMKELYNIYYSYFTQYNSFEHYGKEKNYLALFLSQKENKYQLKKYIISLLTKFAVFFQFKLNVNIILKESILLLYETTSDEMKNISADVINNLNNQIQNINDEIFGLVYSISKESFPHNNNNTTNVTPVVSVFEFYDFFIDHNFVLFLLSKLNEIHGSVSSKKYKSNNMLDSKSNVSLIGNSNTTQYPSEIITLYTKIESNNYYHSSSVLFIDEREFTNNPSIKDFLSTLTKLNNN
jgi:hypothetical protein